MECVVIVGTQKPKNGIGDMKLKGALSQSEFFVSSDYRTILKHIDHSILRSLSSTVQGPSLNSLRECGIIRAAIELVIYGVQFFIYIKSAMSQN
jgi:hypothetical protein